MANPWEEIDLADYEAHMALDSVMQLQALSEITGRQLSDYPVSTAMILGVAGGNGLEHVDPEKYEKVYGIDINAEYLGEAKRRHAQLAGVLECIRADLTREDCELPHADLVIANLLVEYVGYSCFARAVGKAQPRYVSAAIQVNLPGGWVSESPYLHVFDGLDEVHHQVSEEGLSAAMRAIGYRQVRDEAHELPNGKRLVRLDFEKIVAPA